MARKKKGIKDIAEERSYVYQRELSMNDFCSDDHIVARRMGYKDGYVDGHKETKDKLLKWVEAEMERLWELLPDADNDNPTEMELRYLGQYMQMESLELFLETL
jgi:hypothetical protein